MERQTEKLIKKIKLKPSDSESVYSQSFMDRERDMIKRIKDLSEKKINKKFNTKYHKNKKMTSFHNSILHTKLGLKRKLTVAQQLAEFSSIKTGIPRD